MPQKIDLTPALKVTVLKHLLGGRTDTFIETATGLTHDQVLEVKRDHGHPDPDKMAWAVDILTQRLDEIPESAHPLPRPARPVPSAAATSVTTTPRPPAPSTLTVATQPAADAVRALLDLGATSEKARTRNLAAKIDELLTDLQGRLDDEKAAREAAAAEAKAKAARDAEIAKLEARLAELKSAKGGGVHTKGQFPCPDPDCDFVGTSAQSRGGHVRYHHRDEQTGNLLVEAG